MRKKIVAGNWKMNNTLKEGIDLVTEINSLVEKLDKHAIDVIIAPPYIHLSEICKIINTNYISIAAQNCAAWPFGAYTGEVSAEMIRLVGCDLCFLVLSSVFASEDNYSNCFNGPTLTESLSLPESPLR